MRKLSLLLLLGYSSLHFTACKKAQTLQSSAAGGAGVTSARSVITSDYAEYNISCVAGGKFIEVTGNPTYNEKYTDQRQIVQYGQVSDQERDAWQRWYVIYRTTVNGVKYYHIRNSFSGKLLEVPGGTSTSGTQLQQYREFPLLADQQLWKLVRIGSTEQYNIVNKGNGLAIANANGSTSNGTAIIQETLSTNDRQKWIFTSRSASTYRDDQVVGFFERNNNSQGSVAFDQGASVPLTSSLNNGKVLWITQDAYDGDALQANKQFNCGQFFKYGNSMFLQSNVGNWGSDAPNITRNNNRQVIDKQPNNSFAWPGWGVEIGNHVYLHVGEGNGLAMENQSLWDLTESSSLGWTGVRTTPAGMSNQTTVNYSIGAVKRNDGYVYAFGSGNNSALFVARFAQSNPQSWTFWNGSSWASTPSTAAQAQIGTGNANTAISFVNNKWVMMTMDNGFFCGGTRGVYVSTASSVTGPFTTPVKVWTIQEKLNGQDSKFYTGLIHPEQDNGKGELLLTYSLNYEACGQSPCTNNYMDPYFYRVKGIRVPYSKVGL